MNNFFSLIGYSLKFHKRIWVHLKRSALWLLETPCTSPWTFKVCITQNFMRFYWHQVPVIGVSLEKKRKIQQTVRYRHYEKISQDEVICDSPIDRVELNGSFHIILWLASPFGSNETKFTPTEIHRLVTVMVEKSTFKHIFATTTVVDSYLENVIPVYEE